MTKRSKWVAGVFLLAALGGSIGLVHILSYGFSARDRPTKAEEFIARQFRRWAIPRAAREMKNPVPLTPEVIKAGMAHFADHCALCHANDGSGRTEIGQNLYPKAPNMRVSPTQSLSDGEIFYVIKNGIRLTGMPAWGGDTPESDRHSWHLVHFIRHLPRITKEEILEMQRLNPKSPGEMREQKKASQQPSHIHHH